MVSDTSLTTWNGLTQPACFSSHHFRWHFSLYLSVLYIQHSVKWFLEPLQPHQPCGGGGWAGGSSGEEKATACCVHVFALSMHYRSSFNHPASVKWILKVLHQPFFAFQSSAPSGSDRSGSSATAPLKWSGIKASCWIPVSGRCLWSRWCLVQAVQCSQQLLCPAPCVPWLHPPSRHNPHTQPPPELAHSSPIPSALFSSFPAKGLPETSSPLRVKRCCLSPKSSQSLTASSSL